jgi:hypothetical protein
MNRFKKPEACAEGNAAAMLEKPHVFLSAYASGFQRNDIERFSTFDVVR